MIRHALLFLFFLIPLLPELSAQESLEPLRQNPYVKEQSEASAGLKSQHDSAYLPVYPIDTLTLPIRDDFSRDRFKPYDTDTSATGVEDSIFYRLFETNGQILHDTIGSWAMDSVGWMSDPDTSFILHLDTLDGDSVVVDSRTPLPSREILVNDLWTPEHDTFSLEVWPAFTVHDSSWLGTVDTVKRSPPDYIQDSLPVFYFPSESTNLWVDNYVFLNNTLVENPPTIGFATFDGLNENGYPYNFNNPYAYGEADQLTSKPIDLDPFTPLDSVFFSFFQQRGGFGNEPESEDSLVLEFYAPEADEWEQVWSREGGGTTSPEQVMVSVQDPKFLHTGFRFRFKNFATLSGGFDHWHVDYIRLHDERDPNDTVISDIAFTQMPDSYLETYTSVPWQHYQADPGHVREEYTSHHRNLDDAGRFVEFHTRGYFEGTEFWQHNQGIDAAVDPNSNFTHSNLIGGSPADLSFDPNATDTSASFRFSLIERTNPDTNANNDSITFQQDFENYYAFDDGTAEAAYGISPSGANTPKIAQRFDPYIADTLLGAYIHFVPSFEDMSGQSFFLTVWEDDGGVPGGETYKNISFDRPNYGDDQGHFGVYTFDEPVVMEDAGAFFIGIDQTTQDRINIGMDRNNDNSQRIYFHSGGGWQNTSFDGSLMIRPIYKTQIDVLNLEDLKQPETFAVSVHPNPTRGRVRIVPEGDQRELSVQVFDMQGRKVKDERSLRDGRLDLSGESEGLYILRIRDRESGRRAVEKLMLQR